MDVRQSRTHKIPGGKWYRLVLVISVLVAVALFSVGTVSHPSVAHAGNNGQQVGLYLTCPPLTYAQVSADGQSGSNQNGDPATWKEGNLNGATSVVTTGWWWKNHIYIYYFATDGTRYEQEAWVPQQMDGDIDWIPCDGTPF